MKLPVILHLRRIRQLQWKTQLKLQAKCFSHLQKEGSSNNNNTDRPKNTPPSTAPASAKALEPTNESSLVKFLKHTQGVVEESSGLIELVHLKQNVQAASDRFDKATNQVSDCRTKVLESQKAHEQAHKKHVSLLMRRDEWSPDDAQSFVTITSEEVQTRQALGQAQESLRRSEDHAIQCQHSYMDIMRQRYHEEQIWQDKWRLLGTYGTWALIGVNTLVFLVGQYRAEKREINRLDHMEHVLLKNYSEKVEGVAAEETEGSTTSEDDGTADPTPLSSEQANTTIQAESGTDADKDETLTESKDSEHQATTKAEQLTSWLNNTNDFLASQKIALHPPSVAFGAVITGTCVIIVSLASRR